MRFTTRHLILALSLSVALSPTVAAAEPQSGCLQLKETKSWYDAVAAGTKMAFVLTLRTHHCHLPVDAAPLTLAANSETQPGLSLQLGHPAYGKTQKSGGEQTADELTLTVVVSPSRDISPGNYQVQADLDYQAVDSNGNVLKQSLPVSIPVKVVSSASQVHFKQDHSPRHVLGQIGLTAAGIVLLPVVAVTYYIVDVATGKSIFAD